MTQEFSEAFKEAMQRVSAQRLMPETRKLLRRHPLMTRGMPNTSFSIYNLMGWRFTAGALRK